MLPPDCRTHVVNVVVTQAPPAPTPGINLVYGGGMPPQAPPTVWQPQQYYEQPVFVAQPIGDGMSECHQQPVMFTTTQYVPTARTRRMTYSREQVDMLERVFLYQTKYPDLKTRRQLAQQIRVNVARVQIWFKNRRARERNYMYRVAPQQDDGRHPPQFDSRRPMSHGSDDVMSSTSSNCDAPSVGPPYAPVVGPLPTQPLDMFNTYTPTQYMGQRSAPGLEAILASK